MSGWPEEGLADDIRPRLFEAWSEGRTVALSTIVAADGGPRPVGSQMLIDGGRTWGFLSGGCIEDDVALNAAAVIEDGKSQLLVYGRGSPFVDMRLPCGGRLEVLVERIEPGDEAVAALRRCWLERVPARWRSDGRIRSCEAGEAIGDGDIQFDPPWRLRVIGDDPFALAIAAMGQTVGLDTRLLAPFADAEQAPFGLAVDRRGLAEALGDEPPDAFTAMVLATHDVDLDEEALGRLLQSKAGYIGVLGSRRRIAERTARLKGAGFSVDEIARIRMPLGLPIRARSPWEVAVSAIGEIIATRRS
ncbi:XdhC family protein [Sphingomonas sp. LY29]|uniref:XdhC family protein n=1 Tax=Sphingomonas sp. LY29 TaxID=3095341 RepID=UPI002D789D07|nr:XdhC family protein [Sphingomonas sp. LY29]WRP25053.1 XdhC family protein [Sphingomonas sp. LY29]